MAAAKTKQKTKPTGTGKVVKFLKKDGKLPASTAAAKPKKPKVPFVPLGESVFPVLIRDEGTKGKVGVNGVAFNGTRATSWVTWPNEPGEPPFVPRVKMVVRFEMDNHQLVMTPNVAGNVVAAAAVALAEAEIQAPERIASGGTGREWQQVVALMRRLKMIDASMSFDMVDVP